MMNRLPGRIRAGSMVAARYLLAVAVVIFVAQIGALRIEAACPPGHSNPITSGTGVVDIPVIISGLDADLEASFFLLGVGGENNSGTLEVSDWLVDLGDLDGDGLPEYRIDAPGEGPGGWGDPRAVGCPSTIASGRPPLVVLIHHDEEDLDDDGAFDVFEDIDRDGVLDQIFDPDGNIIYTEDRDGDGRLTRGSHFGRLDGECEGAWREDIDCDGNLDRLDEDSVWCGYPGDPRCQNGILDVGEDIDHDGRLDAGIEDRNGNSAMDDRPFPGAPGDSRRPDENGNLTYLYPYGALRPTGAFFIGSVDWNGSAYDFDAINTPTRLLTLADGTQYRVVDATPLASLRPTASGFRSLDLDLEYELARLHVQFDGVDLNDDRDGNREIFDEMIVRVSPWYEPYGQHSMEYFPALGDGAGGGFLRSVIWTPSPWFDYEPLTILVHLRVPGSTSLPVPLLIERNGRDSDRDSVPRPLDNCPDVFNPATGGQLRSQADVDDNGIGDACDPALDPGATLDDVWTEVTSAVPPAGVWSAAATYDGGRGVIVLFGRHLDPPTWEYDGSSWLPAPTTHAPPGRTGHRMVFDSTRGRVLMFGGSHGTVLNDLWEYDGVDWSEITPSVSPPPRTNFGMAYDSARDLVVLFGGSSGLPLGDTWVFDGIDWHLIASPRSPAPAEYVAMTYDSFHEMTILRGHPATYIPANSIWEFDGVSWESVDYSGDLPSGVGGAIDFDPIRRQIMTFGSHEPRKFSSSGGPPVRQEMAATRLYDGFSWRPLATLGTPPPGELNQVGVFDPDRRVFVAVMEDQTYELQGSDDADGDGIEDVDDNCPLIDNTGQIDMDDDGVGDDCDNCVEVANPTQGDLDRDHRGDVCDDDIDGDGFLNEDDSCPASLVFYHPAGVPLDGGLDLDGDGIAEDCDACPADPENDLDGDGVCGDVDNCPGAANPLQEDWNSDGSGDACQPVVDILDIREDGGEFLEVTATAEDPEGDTLSGAVELLVSQAVTLLNLYQVPLDCDTIGFYPEGVPGEGIGYGWHASVGSFLFDVDSGLGCVDFVPDFTMALGGCDQAGGGFSTMLDITNVTPPFTFCLRSYPPSDEGVEYTVSYFDESSLQFAGGAGSMVLEVPFSAGLPHEIDISSLTDGPYLLRITVTDGSTVPVSAELPFLYQGESTMLIGSGVPSAVIVAETTVECDGSSGALVTLDGSGSTDGGLGDPLVSFEWFEDPGLPSEEFLGSGPILDVTLSLGEHRIGLRVTDAVGQQGSAEITITVQDTLPPELSLAIDPFVLWPPNHKMVPVQVAWQVEDLCDPEPAVVLVSVTSSEADNAPGDADGDTSEDIGGAETGTPDGEIVLRAERSGNGAGRTYQATYAASDASGNATQALGVVTVPHDQGSGPEPLLMRLEPNGVPGMVRIFWAAVPEASGYDVIMGELSQIDLEIGYLSLGEVSVLAREYGASSLDEGETGLMPEPGAAVFYLIQQRSARGGVGYGTESAPWPRQPAACGGGCP